MTQRVHEPISTWEADRLGRQSHVLKFLHRLAREDCPPVIGLYGGWGAGKTSFLNMARDYYSRLPAEEKSSWDRQLHFEMIDAWRYERVGNLMIPVMARLQQLTTRDEDRARMP